jgi:hypothetical protein
MKIKSTILTFCAAAISPLMAACAESATSPYGVNAHLMWLSNPKERIEECRWISATGIKRVRFGLQWQYVQTSPDAPFNFARYDRIVAELESAGLTFLPIVDCPPKWARPVWDHLPEYARFVEAVMTRYGDKFPDIEIWNEVNIWRPCTPERYFDILRTAYTAAKKVKPNVRVLFSGTAGVALDFLGRVYELGGKDYFDVVNIHPYCHPRAPEGWVPNEIKSLRALMAKYGDEKKPIVITEHGWPTHDARVKDLHVLLAGLKIADPQKQSWRAVYAATSRDDGKVAEALAEGLPSGSTAETCFGSRLRERLAAGDVDLIVYPFDESFPSETFDDVAAFVDKGGTLAVLGGMPMWYPARETSPGVFQIDDGTALAIGDRARKSLRIDSSFWADAVRPLEKGAFPTAAAVAAGFKGDPAGEKASRYQTPRLLKSGDEFIPLLTQRDSKGNEGVVASVTRLNGGKNGKIIISGTVANRGSVGEDGQARYLVRSMAISFALGIEQYFWYEFRSPEKDPFYSEHHYGLTHKNFTPKLAWGAYRNFVLARPDGSVQNRCRWHDKKSGFYFPQWTRPDGTKAGVLWSTGSSGKRTLRFKGGEIRFRSCLGLELKPIRTNDGGYLVPVSGDPIYFEGGEIIQ